MGRIAVGNALFPAMILGSLGLAIPTQFSVGAASAEAAAASAPASHTVDLNYQETDEVLVSRSVSIGVQNNPFQKEPALPGQNVFRGSLLWGPRPEQGMPFIWDKGRGRLLLDLNRNRDLTDDPKGLLASASKGDGQTFTNTHLVLPTATGDRSVRLRLDFYCSQGASVRAYAGLCSYWEARLSLNGKEWQLGLVENVPDGKTPAAPVYMLLRSWAERQRPFHLTSASPDFFNYTTNLFFGACAYVMNCRYEPAGDSPKYRVTLKEQTPRLGELKVTGTDLHRVILTAKPAMTVLLDQPAGTVKLPVGSYSLDEIWLRKGELDVGSFRGGRLSVDARRAASLVAGGPLTNSVEVGSQGDALQLNYRLVGAGGHAYAVPQRTGTPPPEFAIFQGTNRLAAGKFRYG